MNRRISRILNSSLHSDWHLHDSGSHDACGSPLEYAREALKKGITSICITNHGEEFNYASQTFEVSLPRDLNKALETRRLIEEARLAVPEVEIKFGIEFENNPRCYAQMEEIMARVDFDVVIGSVHLLENVPVSNVMCKDFLRSRKPEDLYRAFYREMTDFAEWGRFDILGHPDIIRRYMVEVYPDVKPLVPYDALRNIFTLLRNRGQGVEINTSGLLQAPKDAYPSSEIIELALDCGIERFSLGSDAHKPADVGRSYEVLKRIYTD